VNIPPTNHQNGVIERKHRDIVEMRLPLLSQASLLMTYWDHVFHTVVYLINRLSTSALLHYVPYSKAFHKIPNYDFFKVLVVLAIHKLVPIIIINLSFNPLLEPF